MKVVVHGRENWSSGVGLAAPVPIPKLMLVWPGRDLGLEDSQILGFKVWISRSFFHSGRDLSALNLGRRLAVLEADHGPGKGLLSCMNADARLILKAQEYWTLSWRSWGECKRCLFHPTAPFSISCEGLEWIPGLGELVYALFPPARQSSGMAMHTLPLR